MDTFKNTETASLHKDVTVFTNDGTRSVEDMQKMSVGCDASMRYHEKRADFSPTNSSRIKIQYDEGTLKVSVDAKSSGVWEPCTTMTDMGGADLMKDFTKRAFLSITASTGALADNHDVLGLTVYGSSEDQISSQLDSQTAHNSKSAHQKFGGDHLAMLKHEVGDLQLELEHKLTAVNDGLQHSFKKLQKQEAELEQRLETLEQRLHDMLNQNMERRMHEVQTQTADNIESSMSAAMSHASATADQKLNEFKSKTAELHAAAGGGWKMPFFILVVLLLVVVFFGYQKYQEMRKSHLL